MFVEEYLQDLRRDRFTPRALHLYGRRVAGRVREHIYANPGAVRSIWSVALGFFAATFVIAAGLAVGLDRHLAYDFFLLTSLWLLPVFAVVTLGIDLLRDRDGFPLSAINVPTTLTVLRVVLAPGLALFLLDRHLVLALVAYLIAALSDVADGWLARRWRQETKLGSVLDPLVDIVFNLAVFFALTAADLLPRWVFAMAAARYGLLLLGGTYLRLFVGPFRIRPTFFGRATGVLASSLVGFLILLHCAGGPVSERLVRLTESATGVLLGATFLHVVVMGWYNLRLLTGEAAKARGRVVGDVRWRVR
jgi:cardiolipin synthase